MLHTRPDVVRALTAVVPAVAAAVAGGAGIARVGLTNGEAATVYAARLPWPQFVHLIKHVDLAHATYYVAMHVLVLLGGGVVAMRSVSLVATVLAAALVGLLGSRLTDSAVSGTLAGLAFALCPTVDGDAKTARSYGILPLLIVLTIVAFLWAVRGTGRRSAWVPYFAVLLVTVYVHELTMLLLTAFVVTLLVLRPARRVWVSWTVVSGAVVVLALPLVYYTHRESRAVAWITSPGLSGFATTAKTFAGPSPAALAVYGIGALAAVAAGLRAWRGHGPGAPGNARLLAVALPVAIVPAAVLIAESSVALPLFDSRYVSYYQPAAALVVGHGLACLGRGLVGVVDRPAAGRRATAALGGLATGLAGLAVALVVQLPLLQSLTTPLGYYQDYGAAAGQILRGARPGDGIAYLPVNLHYLPDGYPRLRTLDDFAQRVTPTQAGTFQGRTEPIATAATRMLHLHRIWVVSKYGHAWLTPLFRRELQVLHHDFRVARRWSDNGLSVALWVRHGLHRHT